MTMLRVLQVSLIIGRTIAKVLIEVGKRVEASTPEERAEIREHVVAIYQILKGTAERATQDSIIPLGMLQEEDGGTTENGASRVAQLRQGLSILRYMAREYARHLDKENRAEIKQHLSELNRIIRDIDRRAKAR